MDEQQNPNPTETPAPEIPATEPTIPGPEIIDSSPSGSVPGESPTEASPPKTMPAWVFAAIAVVALLGFGVSAYFNDSWPFQSMVPPISTPTPEVSPTPNDPTSDWQTYRNEEYGFEFRYPIDRKVGNIQEDTIFVGTSASFESEGFLSEFGVSIINVFPNTDFNTWLQQNEPKDINGETLLRKSTDINFLNISARDQEVFAFDQIVKQIIFLKDNKIFILSYDIVNSKIPNFEVHKKISDQILSTFKFIEPSVGQFCGGIAAIECPAGSYCKLEGTYPDAGGECVNVDSRKINTYDSCIAAGYAMMKSLPPKCATDEGLVFVQHELCVQVIASAKNPLTGETREFPTPCDIPEGWEKI